MAVKKFRTEMMGYHKQDVYDYIGELAKTFEATVKEKDDTIKKLTAENNALKAENNDLKKQMEGQQGEQQLLEDAKKTIGDAIVNAQEQARRIKEEAYREFDIKKESIEKMVAEEKAKLEAAKQELLEFRQKTASFLQDVMGRIDTMVVKNTDNE